MFIDSATSNFFRREKQVGPIQFCENIPGSESPDQGFRFKTCFDLSVAVLV